MIITIPVMADLATPGMVTASALLSNCKRNLIGHPGEEWDVSSPSPAALHLTALPWLLLTVPMFKTDLLEEKEKRFRGRSYL